MIVPPVPAPATNTAISLLGKSDVDRAYYRASGYGSPMQASHTHFDLLERGVVVRERVVGIGVLV